MRFKGLRITRKSDTEFEVVPLYFAKGKGTITMSRLGRAGKVLAEVMTEVIALLVGRRDLRG